MPINRNRRETFIEYIQYTKMLGKVVVKRSRKPFKSGNIKNTINGIVINEYTNLFAFTFDEDDSNVECFRCKLDIKEVALNPS